MTTAIAPTPAAVRAICSGVQSIAVGATLIASYILHLVEKRWAEIQEALIGSLFVLTPSGSILLMAASPHGGEHLKELLVGQILWVSYAETIPVALLYLVVLGLWFSLRQGRSSLLFVTLILPALALRQVERTADLMGYLIAATGYAQGLILAALVDLPAGAVIVYTLSLSAFTGSRLIRYQRNSGRLKTIESGSGNGP